MKQYLLKALDVQTEEWGSVSLLLTISFSLGIFLVTYDVGTSSLFLNQWGQEHLSEAFTLAGVLGVFVSYIFVSLQSRMPFYSLVKAALFISFLYVLALSFILDNLADNKFIVYLSFASLGPLNAIGLLSFYGVVTRSFNVKNQKRLTGTVDQGQMFATALAFFFVPVIQWVPFFNHEKHFLFISSAGVAVTLILLNIYFNKYRENDLRVRAKVRKESKTSFVEMMKNPYIRLLCLLFLFSVLATFFVELSFLSVLADQYTDPITRETDSERIASFLGIYGGTLTVFSLILQIFLGDRIIETYGIKIALLILPILLAAITAISALVGSTAGYQVAAVGTSAVYFFIFIALSKFFLQSSKESFEEPIFKNFFLPVDSKLRHDVQAKVEGVFQQFSIVVAGGLLTVLGAFHFFELVHYSYFLVFVFIGYAYTVIKIHQEYQTTLKNTLATQKGKDSVGAKVEYSVAETLQEELKRPEHERVIYSLKLMEKMEPFKLESILISLSMDKNPEIRKYAIERIHKLKVLAAVPSVKKASEREESPLIKRLAQEALENINKTESIAASGAKLGQMVKSKNPEEREYAAKIVGRSNNEESTIYLLFLMRDTNPKVRMAAILSSANCKNPELWPLLTEHLSSATFGNAAAGVLASYGPSVLHHLETAFHRSGQSLNTQLRIIQIYGTIRGEEAIDLLWDKIEYPIKKIRTQTLLSLSNCNFRVGQDRLAQIKQTLETAIGNAAWNVAALSEVGNEEANQPIRDALEEEIKQDHELIFLLLSFIYDAQSIRLVKENLESGTVEGHLYGIELLDIFLEDDLQPLLFPLLEEIAQADRNEKLQNYFPRETLDSTQVLLHIINRDYNYVNRWTKACAIFGLSVAPGYKVTDDLIANLFNPDPLLRETAAWVIHYLDKKVYEECTQRLSPAIKKAMDDTLFAEGVQRELRIERIVALKQTKAFESVPAVILADLEEIMEVEDYEKGETLIKRGENGDSPLYIVVTGEVGLFNEDVLLSTIRQRELLGEMLLLDSDITDFSAVTLTASRVYKIEKSRLFELMSNNFSFTKEYLKIIGSRWTKDIPVEQDND